MRGGRSAELRNVATVESRDIETTGRVERTTCSESVRLSRVHGRIVPVFPSGRIPEDKTGAARPDRPRAVSRQQSRSGNRVIGLHLDFHGAAVQGQSGVRDAVE